MTKNDKIKSAIRKVITNEQEDTLLNHLKTWWKGNGDFNGIITETGFKVWRCHWFWTGVGYPVVIGEISEANNRVQINLKTKINKAGMIFMLFLLFLWIILLLIILIGGTNLNTLFSKIIVSFLYLVIFGYPFVAGYRINREKIFYEIEEIIKATNNN